MPSIKRTLTLTACLSIVVGSPAAADEPGSHEPGSHEYERVHAVYEGDTTVIGQSIAYPAGEAEIVSVVVTLLPGEETGWHEHGVPLFGYILEGELEVDYGPEGTRTYTEGVGFMEALETAHNGRNTGDEPCRVLAVFMGAQGAERSWSVPAPTQ